MSHCLGVICETCDQVLQDAACPERGCRGCHGYQRQSSVPWPDHRCRSLDVQETVTYDGFGAPIVRGGAG